MEWEITEYTIRVRRDADSTPPTDGVEAFCEELLRESGVTGLEMTVTEPKMTEMQHPHRRVKERGRPHNEI